MATNFNFYEFNIILHGKYTEIELNTIAENYGSDSLGADCTVGMSNQIVTIQYSKRASSLLKAIDLAIDKLDRLKLPIDKVCIERHMLKYL